MVLCVPCLYPVQYSTISTDRDCESWYEQIFCNKPKGRGDMTTKVYERFAQT